MQRLFFGFPSGLPGAGLLLLRVAITLLGAYEMEVCWLGGGLPLLWGGVLKLVSLLAFTSLFVGLFTPLAALTLSLRAAAALVLAHLAGALFTPPVVLVFAFLSMTLVCAAVGPGAVSIDARLFGRRELVFHD